MTDDPHRRGHELEEAEGQLPTLSMDYCYLNSGDGGEDTLPCLVVKCHRTKRFWASALPAKGADSFGVAWLGSVVDDAGFTKMILKSDGEPALVALKQKVKESKSHLELHLMETPVEDHKANGFIEVGVRELKRQCRALLSDLQHRLGFDVEPHHPLMLWLPRHAAFLLTRYRVGPDGKTAFERTYGKKWRIPLVRFGEHIMYRPRANRGGRRDDVAPRVSMGMYVGTGNRNADVFVMTERGIMKGNSIHRRPEADQFVYENFGSLRGLPWKLQDRDHAGLRIALPAMDIPRERQPVQEVVPRNLYVMKSDLEKFGHTPLCPGCEAAIMELPNRAHNAECRLRIQTELNKTPEGQARIKKAKDRVEAGKRPRDVGVGGAGPLPVVPGGAGDADVPALQDRPPADDEMAAGEAVGEPLDEPRASEELKRREEHREEELMSPKRHRGAERRGEKRQPVEEIEDLHAAAAGEGGGGSSSSTSRPQVDTVSGDSPGSVIPTGEQSGEAKEVMYLCSLLKEVAKRGKVAEIFSPPRVAAQAQVVGLHPGFSVDLATQRPDGKHWDLSKDSHVKDLMEIVDFEKPAFLGGSPPCGPFSVLQNMVDTQANVSQEKRAQRLSEGRKHLRTCATAYRKQMDGGRYFYHEHPDGAASWETDIMASIRSDPRVYEVKGPMCRWGMTARDKHGTGLVKKQTRWLTNSPVLAAALEGCCSNSQGKVWHRHVHLIDGRAKAAQVYPPRLVHGILKAIRKQLEMDEICSLDAGPVPDAAPVINEEDEWYNRLPDSDEYVTGPVYDSNTGVELDAEKVKLARMEELEWMKRQKIYTKVPISEAHAAGKRIISMKWVDRNKGDSQRPNFRSRLVCREVKRASDAEYIPEFASFSAMPPLEGLKTLLSLMTTLKRSKRGNALVLRLLDISRAHFYGCAERDVFVELPEGDRQEGYCGRLLKSVYGTRDAAAIWEKSYSHLLVSAGFVKSAAFPTCFYNEALDVRILVHGDDFVVLGDSQGQHETEQLLRSQYDLRVDGAMGPGESKQEFTVLNRIVSYDPSTGVASYEADPRHVDQMLRELELERCKPVKTPSEKMSAEDAQAKLEAPTVSPDRLSFFRSLVMRASYISQDRPDISECVKSPARRMHEPKEVDFQNLKRLARYLKGKPRVVLKFYPQKPGKCLNIYADSDFAGDLLTRRSTSGIVVQHGSHTIKHSSSLQSTISLSSGEAEFYAVVKATSLGISLQELYRHWNVDVKIKVYTDSSAALGTASRRGLGKSRHVQTRFLWVQEKLSNREFELLKVATHLNLADTCTKPLAWEPLAKHMASMHFEFVEGRAQSAKDLAT